MTANDVTKNRLLAALPSEKLHKLIPHLHSQELPRGKILTDVNERIRQIHFPKSCVVSMVCLFDSGESAELATIGREGMIDVGVHLGGDEAFARYIVRSPGSALAIEVGTFRRLAECLPTFQALLSRYTKAFLASTLQSAACNSVHPLEERCARWLLTLHDRSDGNSVALTQEFLAEMLGVTRSAVNPVARKLARAGLIRYSRGTITILDRPRLEAAACECYRLIRGHYDRHLPLSFAK